MRRLIETLQILHILSVNKLGRNSPTQGMCTCLMLARVDYNTHTKGILLSVTFYFRTTERVCVCAHACVRVCVCVCVRETNRS